MHILIIGAGSIGERHIRNFLRIGGVRCSVAETNTVIRDRIAADYPLQGAYEDYRDASLSDFDGIVICVPTNLHINIAQSMVEAGANVLLEKPLSMSLEGVDDLQRLVEEKSTIFSVAYTLRSDPLYRELRDRIIACEAGAVRLVSFYLGQYWPRMRKGYPPAYAQSRATGGGAIPDHLIHIINFLEWCFGLPEEVSAGQWRLGLPDISTEDTASMVIKFKTGLIAYLGICLFQQDSAMRVQVIGEKTTIQLREESDSLEIFDSALNTWRRGKATKLDRDSVFMYQAQHFLDCIRGEGKPRCNLEEAAQTLRTMLAALQSGDTDSRFVRVGN